MLYFNGALHYLQLVPYRNWDISDKNAYLNWLHAERIVQRFLNDTLSAFPQIEIVFMTSHSICEQKFTGEYKEALVKLKKKCNRLCRSVCTVFRRE